ncbi:hypothetical protein MKX57_17495 [Lysinibacillus sp. FSL M8-0216]|uniref:hypothetical protein n=1 Tax=Lysinibacillus sp. FSL M8-0216 TaxID=2921619 RepID=UPI00315A3BBC
MINQLKDFFINIVDECIVETSNKETLDMMERHEIENGGNINKPHINKLLEDILKEKFKEKGEIDGFEIYKLSNQLALEYLIFNRDTILQSFKVLAFIRAYTNGETTFPAIYEVDRWKSLLTLILDYRHLSKKDYTEMFFTDKLKLESSAAKYWIQRGYNVGVLNGKIHLDDSTYLKMGDEVEKKLISLGGYNVLEMLLKKVPYDENALRYRILRDENSLELPFGYLINLSVKHFIKLNHSSNKLFQKNLDELLLMASNLVALLQLQTFNKYSHLSVNRYNFIEYVYSNVLRDKISNFRQYKPLIVPKIINGMLKDIFKEFKVDEQLGIEMNLLLELINYILNNPDRPLRFREYKSSDFERKFPNISKNNLIKILNIFSHDYKSINKQFRSPNDISDFELRPLIKKNEKYFLVDRTINSISFYEILCQFMRGKIDNFDSKLGTILENFIKQELDKRNITYFSGYYNQNEECDLIIETQKFIFLVEIKKKPLTRKALSGDDVTIFSDLTKGLLSSQLQLGKREIELLKHGKIDLYLKKGKRDNKLIHSVEHKNRIIERVSLNAWDYGVMNDKIFSQTILMFLTGVELTTNQLNRRGELNGVNKICKELQNQFEEIQKYSSNNSKPTVRELYFNCSFVSLQMLLSRIEDVNGNLEFEESMETLKYVTSGAGDPYFEYDYFKKFLNKTEV